ncbi:capsular polysaccharide transport system ATP-binding protein [Rubricella aquisinus]|uniref:Capsular polysaccharide transport system ATP-binding protein n=1 Tax=Rubricella aquisinus TaxID=2028108 RepID=A0A840WRK0_9RHOB|nr:ATP-binding cassette domain-containing protein [Rubricella aquisinus]MBB5516663.1 capsular polysaccharide transport system ATP-binding protein [Rubricella aquisinus]
MIEFRNVSKSFWTGERRKVILDRASFRVTLGKSLGILAPNGTGKSTLISMMAGLIKPDEGQILRTSRISFPMGFTGVMDTGLSGAENARFAARFYGVDPDYVEAFCRWLCDIDEYFDQPTSTYSSGMSGRLSLSLMLSLEFDIFLVDEGMPTTASAEFVQKAGAILRQRLEHATLVMVSHNPQQLRRFCESAAVLRNGRLYFFDTLEEASQMYEYDRRFD